MFVKQAVFLVGGKGTRLGELTQKTPKPLLEIAPNVRFLDVLLEEATRRGFTEILLLAGHMGDQVVDAYQGKKIYGATVKVLREPEPQGTGGALAFAKDHLDPWFIMSNGDSLFDINLRELSKPIQRGRLARMALREVEDPARYGAVELDHEIVTAFREKSVDLKGPALINGGIYFMNHELADMIDGPCSIEQDIFPKLVETRQIEGQQFEGFFLDIGLPNTYAEAQKTIPNRRLKPCAFLDRDGLLNEDKGYTHKPEDLNWIEGAKNAIKKLNEAGYYVIIVTNQAGVARGYYTLEDVDKFHAEMSRQLALHGAYIDAFYACPFHADGVVPEYTHPNHPERKPNPGMILKAQKTWPINMQSSFILGDKQGDVDAGLASGIDGHLYDGSISLSELVDSAIEKSKIKIAV